MTNSYLLELVKKQKQGIAVGTYSVCSAHHFVIEATMEQALNDGGHVLIEATANQVNQFGGYTGMRPEDFRALIHEAAFKAGVARERVILGGDHLGPYPWCAETADSALRKGCDLVRAYVKAGFSKIHLDASMKLGGDPDWPGGAVRPELVAERTALLCQAAEESYLEMKRVDPGAIPPVYVIGTDVPTPGGAFHDEGPPLQTTVEELEGTIKLTKKAFLQHNLDEAWKRVIAVVVQTGSEFGEGKVYDYDPQAMGALSTAIRGYENLVFEGHSTDYQKPSALRRMVRDGIAFLKVGPALTFAMREAIFLLCHIENELLREHTSAPLSNVKSILDKAMRGQPEKWEAYYRGDEQALRFRRKYSLLDRSRYYWSGGELKAALSLLLKNLRDQPPPLTLVSQYFNEQYLKIREGCLDSDPEALIKDRIKSVLRLYSRAVFCQGR
jgi:D-tagatose-1,6-bisphosphate aldolase subunit GatZ/KbaZ